MHGDLMRKKILCLLLAACGCTVCADIKLSDCVIYFESDSPQSVYRAGRNSQKFAELATGVRLPIRNRPSTPMIALGANKSAEKAGIRTDDLSYEEARIVTSGGNIYIVGKDIPNDGLTPLNGRSYGTFYGSCEFLEKVLDAAWLIPGERGIYVPKRGKDFMIPDLNMKNSPRFSFRKMSGLNEFTADWFAFNRLMNADAGSERHSTNHSWDSLYPQKTIVSKKDPSLKLSSVLETFEKNPEMFGMAKNGRRIAPHYLFSFCLSNPSVVKDMAERIRIQHAMATLDAKGAKIPKMSPISPNDGQPDCWCKACRAEVVKLTEADVGPVALNRVSESWSRPMFRYYRELCLALPDFMLSGHIYIKNEFMPREKIEKMPENFIAVMAPFHTAYGPVRLYAPVNESWKRWLSSWDGISSKMQYYGVDFWLNQSMGAPFSPYPGMMKDTFSMLAGRPFIGGYFYTNQGYGQSGLYMWTVMKMLWNPEHDPENLINEFLTKAYGREAGKEIRKIYDIAEKGMVRYVSGHKGKIGYNLSAEMAQSIYAPAWNEIEKLYFSAVEKSAGADDNQRWRLKAFGENLKLMRYHLSCMGLKAAGSETSGLDMSDSEFQEFNRKRMPGGEFYQNVFDRNAIPNLEYALNDVSVSTDANIKDPDPMKPIFYKYNQDFVVFAPETKEFEMTIEEVTRENPFTKENYQHDIGYYSVYDSSGKFYYHAIARGGKIKFPAEKGKHYNLFYTPFGDVAAHSRWRILSVNMPYAAGQHLDRASGLLMYRHGGTLYFNVRKQVKSFKLYYNGAPSDVEILDPECRTMKRITGQPYEICEFKNPAAGWWRIRFGKSHTSSIRLSSELDGYFVVDPAKALDVVLLPRGGKSGK